MFYDVCAKPDLNHSLIIVFVYLLLEHFIRVDYFKTTLTNLMNQYYLGLY